MKPLPDLNDVEAMAAIGRTSALWSARNKTLEALRDKLTTINSAQFDEVQAGLALDVVELGNRLHEIVVRWMANEAAELKRAEKATMRASD